MTTIIDPVWDEKYSSDHSYRNHYPWSEVVSFLFKHYKDLNSRSKTRILELGCGNASNLWFASREGFQVCGIDSSPTAIRYAIEWFKREGLKGDLKVGSLTEIPFPDKSVDVVIDRAAISCTNYEGMVSALSESHRVLVPGGKMLFTPYSDQNSSFYKAPNVDGVVRGIERGNIRAFGGQVLFLSFKDILQVTSESWVVDSINHIVSTDFLNPSRCQDAHWNIVLTKKIV